MVGGEAKSFWRNMDMCHFYQDKSWSKIFQCPIFISLLSAKTAGALRPAEEKKKEKVYRWVGVRWIDASQRFRVLLGLDALALGMASMQNREWKLKQARKKGVKAKKKICHQYVTKHGKRGRWYISFSTAGQVHFQPSSPFSWGWVCPVGNKWHNCWKVATAPLSMYLPCPDAHTTPTSCARPQPYMSC